MHLYCCHALQHLDEITLPCFYLVFFLRAASFYAGRNLANDEVQCKVLGGQNTWQTSRGRTHGKEQRLGRMHWTAENWDRLTVHTSTMTTIHMPYGQWYTRQISGFELAAKEISEETMKTQKNMWKNNGRNFSEHRTFPGAQWRCVLLICGRTSY